MVDSITIEEYLKKDPDSIVLVDIRDKEQLHFGKIENSIHIPLSELSYNLDALDKDKEIYVYCRTGKNGKKAVEELNSLGYNSYNIEGGYKEYKNYMESLNPVEIDAKGQMCPGPIINVADTINQLHNGQRIYVESDEDAFASDIKIWCERTGNTLESLEIDNNIIKATIQKEEVPQIPKDDDKTFIVFSGDLD
ncbi:MAG: sulfurtransferase TusA family protein, partial [Methanobrevibacter sp.]|nr:sulfurtransferase TusA family protein [Methanobrevibacter sp.]